MEDSETEEDLKTFLRGGNEDPLLNINKTFYKDYDADYFSNKAVVLASMVSEPKVTTNQINEGFSVGKISLANADLSEKWVKGYAKRELVINSYHSIESFFRLFFAHVEDPECPWVGVEQIQNFKKFKKRISKLHKRTYFPSDHNDSISSMLLGNRDMYSTLSDDEWSKSVKTVVDLVDRLGYDILTNHDYNAYKHGAAMLDTEMGFQIGDGKILGANKQETFLYLSSEREETDTEVVTKFSKTFKFMRWEQRFVSTYLSGQLIHNLLNLSKARLKLLPKEELEMTSFHNYDLSRLLDENEGRAVVIPTNISELMFVRKSPIVPKVEKAKKQ